ncbi:MAG: hypothetical protein RL701_1945 [Pseudomonadota bacterium]
MRVTNPRLYVVLLWVVCSACRAQRSQPPLDCYSDADCPAGLVCDVAARLCSNERSDAASTSAAAATGQEPRGAEREPDSDVDAGEPPDAYDPHGPEPEPPKPKPDPTPGTNKPPPAATPTGTGRITTHLGKLCIDAAASDLSLRTCSESDTQRWTLGDDDTLRVAGQCLDVVPTAENQPLVDGAKLKVSACNGAPSQTWLELAGELVHALSGLCLDAVDRGTTDGTALQLWGCSGDENQRWQLPAFTQGTTALLGARVFVFDPSMALDKLQRRLAAVFARQVTNQFGSQRFTLLFKPGEYAVDVNVGFYTLVAGLGRKPDDVRIRGAVHVEADWWPGGTQNATQNFWRAAENLAVLPQPGFDRWAVSQGTWYRRMHLHGDLVLDDGGWSSGGFMADSQIDGEVKPGSQQQWLARNSDWARWTGANWNMVFVGSTNAPTQSFPNPANTTLQSTPKIREKPFLFVDASGAYQVFVPEVRTNAEGTSWGGSDERGATLPIDQFAIVHEGDSASSMNAALSAGKNLLFTPGSYRLDEPIHVTRSDTVVLGLGFVTLTPTAGTLALSVADVDGVKIAGLTIDAGPISSATLMRVGDASDANARADHAQNPTSLHDLFFRIGGTAAGSAVVSLEIASSHVLGDNLWLWRADHGRDGAVGWNINQADTGLVVQADDVTVYGLFVEHYQKTQALWRGERGSTYFFQSEAPYDVPSQAAWMNGASQGYPAYKVADSVQNHTGWGLGTYCYFSADPSVVLERAFEVPADASGVQLHDMVTVSLGGVGSILRVINETGAAVNAGQSGPVFVVAGP